MQTLLHGSLRCAVNAHGDHCAAIHTIIHSRNPAKGMIVTQRAFRTAPGSTMYTVIVVLWLIVFFSSSIETTFGKIERSENQWRSQTRRRRAHQAVRQTQRSRQRQETEAAAPQQSTERRNAGIQPGSDGPANRLSSGLCTAHHSSTCSAGASVTGFLHRTLVAIVAMRNVRKISQCRITQCDPRPPGTRGTS